MDRIDLAQDRNQWKALVSTVLNLWLPYNIWTVLSKCTTGSFSRRAQFHEAAVKMHSFEAAAHVARSDCQMARCHFMDSVHAALPCE
jgi:hypothetical protein